MIGLKKDRGMIVRVSPTPRNEWEGGRRMVEGGWLDMNRQRRAVYLEGEM
jgi:hypothetical protein